MACRWRAFDSSLPAGGSSGFRVHTGRDPLTGAKRWATKTVDATGKRDAQHQANAWEVDLREQDAPHPRGTFGDLAAQWIAVKERRWPPNTLQEHRCIVARNLRALPDVDVAKITTHTLDVLYAELAARGGTCTHRPCPPAPCSEHGPRCRRKKCKRPSCRQKGACADWTPCGELERQGSADGPGGRDDRPSRLRASRPEGRGTGNSRNGHYPKTVKTEIGEVDLRVPRDRNGSFAPATVPKGQRRLDGMAGNVISLYAKGLTTGDIQAHLAQIYGTEVSRDTISRITDAIVEDMVAWQNRPLDAVYPVLLIDAIHVKIRDGQIANRPIYVAMGINLDGDRDVLGMWVGPAGGEGAKFWMTTLTELRNRGVRDTFIVCCDGLKGLPDAIRATWPQADVQLCVVHLVRSSLRYTSKKHWGQVSRDLREIYTAPTLEVAEARFDEFAETWRDRYPAMVRVWEQAWAEFVPFLEFPVELRTLVYTTNAIESLNARFRRAVRHRGHFRNEQAALKVLYLVATERRKNRSNPTGRAHGWKQILNALTIHDGDRITAAA